MALHLLGFLGGLGLLVFGGELLVRGASRLARGLGVDPIVIGMTVVAFGTSVPELVVTLLAAGRGEGGVAFGNVVGSCSANIGLILGLTVVARAVRVHDTIVSREIPMMLLAGCATLALAADGTLDGGTDVVGRGDGLVLLLLFCVFLYYLFLTVRRKRATDVFVEQAREHVVQAPVHAPIKSVGLAVLGLALLIAGGQFLVGGAVGLAEGMGVPQSVIGLTIVSVGTSLPELVTSVIAARRGEADLAIGNVVGSNIFNLLFVLGASAAVFPVAVPAGGVLDLLVMVGFCAILLPLARSGDHTLSRAEGFLLLGGYVAYAVWLGLR